MNMRRALLALAAVDAAVAQLSTTAPTAVSLSTNLPTKTPTMAPNASPSIAPSLSPTKSPSNSPTFAPSTTPSTSPSDPPTNTPSNSPTNAPSTTPSHSPSNAPTKKTAAPSSAPSLSPSNSSAPSAPPTQSSQPTSVPSISLQPTAKPSTSPSLEPTQSNYPSAVPTVSAAPSGTPSVQPTAAPIIPPSAAPSMEEVVEVLAEYKQILDVTENFDKNDVDRFCRIYKSYTSQFGYQLGDPPISTKCTVKDQFIGYTRRRKLSFWGRLRSRFLQEETNNYTLIMNFFMKYSTRVGVYNLDNYNAFFTEFVNSNTTKVLDDMLLLQMPVVNVSEVVELEDVSPTNKPTTAPQTESPVLRTQVPSTAPSSLVVPTNPNPESTQDSFVLGLSLGLSGAFAIFAFGFIYYRRLENQKQRKIDEIIKRELSGDNNDMDIAEVPVGDSMEVKVSDHNGVLSQDDITNDGVSENDDGISQGIVRDTNASLHIQSTPPRIGPAYDIESGPPLPPLNTAVSSSVGDPPAANPMAYATMDSIFSQQVSQSQGQYQESFQLGAPTNLMMADGSFSSDSEDELGNPSAMDGSIDELDNYKNNDLEILRDAVEEAVEDVEGILSLAMTRALTESDDAQLPWDSEDSGSIEASCLFETYDWLKRNEESPLDTRNEFFQEVMNNVVITVLFGLMHPLEAAQLAHGIATVIGLPLLKELPKKTLVITGMRKTTDVDRGQHVILAAFERFGPIEQAAIAPNNRGFGFVRFSKPKSVQRALEKYRVAEIEIQNVSVSIKTLENTTPARE